MNYMLLWKHSFVRKLQKCIFMVLKKIHNLSSIKHVKGGQIPPRAVVLFMMIIHVNSLTQWILMHICTYTESFEIASYWSNCDMLKVFALTFWTWNFTVFEKFAQIILFFRIFKAFSHWFCPLVYISII